MKPSAGQGPGQRRLACAGQSPDQDQGDCAGAQVLQGHGGQLPGLGACARITLVGAKAGDFRAHECPVRDVMVAQRGGGGVTGVLAVPVGEALGQVTGAEALQVHRQERGVVQPVDPAQPVVELQAVKDPGPVVQAEDVLGEQVPVPVYDAARADPRLKQGRAPGEEPPRKPLHLIDA